MVSPLRLFRPACAGAAADVSCASLRGSLLSTAALRGAAALVTDGAAVAVSGDLSDRQGFWVASARCKGSALRGHRASCLGSGASDLVPAA